MTMDDEKRAAASNFLSQTEKLSSQTEIQIPNLDIIRPEDRKIALMSLLRGKTVDEYFLIVSGLFEAYDKADGDREQQEKLHNLSSTVMAIGEDVLGIDWS